MLILTSQNLMGSELEQDPSSHFFHEDVTSLICAILLRNKDTNGQRNGHEFKISP